MTWWRPDTSHTLAITAERVGRPREKARRHDESESEHRDGAGATAGSASGRDWLPRWRSSHPHAPVPPQAVDDLGRAPLPRNGSHRRTGHAGRVTIVHVAPA